jgi:hypothetical protein
MWESISRSVSNIVQELGEEEDKEQDGWDWNLNETQPQKEKEDVVLEENKQLKDKLEIWATERVMEIIHDILLIN